MMTLLVFCLVHFFVLLWLFYSRAAPAALLDHCAHMSTTRAASVRAGAIPAVKRSAAQRPSDVTDPWALCEKLLNSCLCTHACPQDLRATSPCSPLTLEHTWARHDCVGTSSRTPLCCDAIASRLRKRQYTWCAQCLERTRGTRACGAYTHVSAESVD